MGQLALINYIIVFLFGIIFGSFLNVCIYRIPKGESIVTGASHCMSCGKRLRWWELIPLFSYVALRGKCSACRTSISPQYPLIEGMNGVLWILVFYVYGFGVDFFLGSAFLSCLLVISVIDARYREIPVSINFVIFILGVIALFVHREKWMSHVLGFFVVSVVLFMVFIASRGCFIGGGDVKLMAAAGLLLGWKLTVFGFFMACVVGSVVHIIRMKFFGAGRDLAMGPYLSAGLGIALLWGEKLLNWYFGLFIF